MTTLITGASGFVGIALTEHLLSAGDHVVGYDLSPPPAAALQAYSALPGRYDMVAGDVRDSASLLQAMRHYAPRRLVTLAAITADSQRERSAPSSIFEVNVNGVITALDAAAECGVTRILHVSSGSVYGASGNTGARLHEARTALRPEGLYGISKQAAEAAALRLAQLHGLDLVVGRLGTCFGPWEAATGARDTLSAPLQVLQCARQQVMARLPRVGLRDWLYVRDAAAAMARLLEQPQLPSRVYNLAAGFEWTIADWCRQVSLRHPGFAWRLAATPQEASIQYYAPYDRASLCIESLQRDTGFAPRFDLAAAAADYHAWALRHDAPATSSRKEHHA